LRTAALKAEGKGKERCAIWDLRWGKGAVGKEQSAFPNSEDGISRRDPGTGWNSEEGLAHGEA